MLQSIRDRSKGWLTTVILSLVCLAFVLWGIQSYLESNGKNDTAAKVNGYPITSTEANAAYERLRQQQQFQLGADFVVDDKIEGQLKKQALDQLIMGQILTSAALKEGYRVTREEVDAALLSIPAFQINGRFSAERFHEALSGMLYTENTFLADLQTTMLVNQLRSGFIESAFSLDKEVDNAIKLINQKRDIGYAIIPAARYKNNLTITDVEAKAYYQHHQNQFAVPEEVSVEYLALSLPQIATQQHFTDAQLKQYYQDNLSNYTQPIRWHVAHILVKIPDNSSLQQVKNAETKINAIADRIRAGESFDKIARVESDDKLSGKNGGELDWFSQGMMDPSLEKVVSSLKQPGELSAPVRTKYGFSVIKLLGIQKPETQGFEKVRSQVEKALAQQQAEKIFADSSEKLANLTYSNPSSLGAAAKALDLTVKTTDLFERKGGKDAVSSNPKIINAAFSTDVLQGNNSSMIALNPDTYVVLRVKQHKPASLLPFEKVKQSVTGELKKQMAQEKAQSVGQTILAKLNQGAQIQILLQTEKLKWEVARSISRFASQVPAAISSVAFHMPRPRTNPSYSAFKLPNGDYVVLAVTAVYDGESTKISETQRRIYREELENSFGQLDYSLYVQGLVNKAKVDVTKSKP